MNSLGVDFKLKNIDIDNKKIKLQIWDTSGIERFRKITQSYYKFSQAVLICFDITDRESFEHVRNWMDDIDKEDILKILVGNKCDLEHERRVRKEEGKEIANKYGIEYIETSAKDTISIENLFIYTAKIILSKQVNNINLEKGSHIIIDNDNEDNNQNNGFCY